MAGGTSREALPQTKGCGWLTIPPPPSFPHLSTPGHRQEAQGLVPKTCKDTSTNYRWRPQVVHSLEVLTQQRPPPRPTPSSPCPSPPRLPHPGHHGAHLRLIRESSCCRCSWTPNGMVGIHILQRVQRAGARLEERRGPQFSPTTQRRPLETSHLAEPDQCGVIGIAEA